MKFKNATTATKQQIGLISAQQHSLEYRVSGRPFRTEAISFDQWFLQGVRRYEAKGAEFELIESGMVKIQWPGKVAVLRTVADFEREYQTNYLKQEITA
jgi:hypothetical protein